MDLGYIVIAIFLGLVGMIIWAMRGGWDRKHHDSGHNPMPGHRQEGSSGSSSGSGDE